MINDALCYRVIYNQDMSAVEIVDQIEGILRNPRNEPADMLGSYIVGATIARDDIEQYYEQCPRLEIVAELGADLETSGGTSYADEVLAKIHENFRILKQEMSR